MKKVPRSFEEGGECSMAHYSLVNESDINQGISVVNTNYKPK